MNDLHVLKTKLERRLIRLNARKDVLELQHKDRESSHYTYWGGFDMGYLKGIISEIEDTLDELNNIMNDNQYRQ